MKHNYRIALALALGVVGSFSRDARADGGVVRLREAQGPFVVTVFTASELVQGRPADVSVLVQDRDSKEAVLDATVELTFDPPATAGAKSIESICGASSANSQMAVAASHEAASNKLLYAASAEFGVAGNWQMEAIVSRDGPYLAFACRLPVGSPRSELVPLLPWLMAPPLAVALFAASQILARRMAVGPLF